MAQVKADSIREMDGFVTEKEQNRNTTANTDWPAVVEVKKDKAN